MIQGPSGVFAPVLTLFDATLAPEPARFVGHCRWIVSQGAGLVPFGTTSEANSMSREERIELLERLVAAGIDPALMMPGTGCCALTDSVRLTRHAVGLGCAGVLMLPPFYYKAVGEEGLFRNYAEIIERVGDPRLRLYLYHIPPIAQVGFGVALIERLLRAYPGVIAGIKDSSGDWSNTEAVLAATRGAPFRVFVGTELFLLRNLRAGGAGCITATANINPAAIRKLFERWQSPDAEALQADLDALRRLVQRYPLIPALKRVLAHALRDEQWATVRPPLVELDAGPARELVAALDARGFSMATG